jgi:hypothetical protein
MWEEITVEWRRLRNEELYDLYCSPNNIRVTKSRRMRWAGHVARMGARRGLYRVLMGRPDVQRPTGRHGRIILKIMFKKWDGAWIGLIWLMMGRGGGLL